MIMTKAVAETKMKELANCFDKVEKIKDEVSALELDTRFGIGIDKYAEYLWEIENRLDDLIAKMAIDITVLQVRIDRRCNGTD